MCQISRRFAGMPYLPYQWHPISAGLKCIVCSRKLHKASTTASNQDEVSQCYCYCRCCLTVIIMPCNGSHKISNNSSIVDVDEVIVLILENFRIMSFASFVFHRSISNFSKWLWHFHSTCDLFNDLRPLCMAL